MASTEAKKAQICSLWGLPQTEIDLKIGQLKCIITDQSESLLLDYLLKADLNIERAIDLHFAQTPSPPAQPIHNNNRHASNHAADELDLSQLIFEDSESEQISRIMQAPKESSEDIEVLNNVDNNSTSPTNTTPSPFAFEFVFTDDDDNDDNNNTNAQQADVLSTNRNINNRNRGALKRKRSSDEQDAFDAEPVTKKRKIELHKRRLNVREDSEEPQNTNSHNINNSNSNSNNSNSANHNHNHNKREPMDTDPAEEDAPEAKHKPNWTKKIFGTLRFEYTELLFCKKFKTLQSVAYAKRGKRITIDKVPSYAIEPDEAKVRELYDGCLEEMVHLDSEKKIGMIATLKETQCLSADTEQDAKYEEAIQKEIYRIVGYSSSLRDIAQQDAFRAYAANRVKLKRTPKKYAIEFEISFNRIKHKYQSNLLTLLRKKKKEQTQFNLEYSANTVALLGGCKLLKDEIRAYNNVMETYTAAGHIYTMVSLLDFACRFDYDTDDTNDNYAHQLNVQLHQYQLQSLRWMMNEENHEIGFYRHLFHKGRFADHTSFYYSAVFEEIIINDTLPIVHGGFLCEEMGLGKTIISIALINCNPPRDLSTYSTRSQLRVAHRNTERRYRWDYSDPINPKRVAYDIEIKYYKSKATLIIAPVSLVGQWEKECTDRCNKTMKCKRYYGNRSRDVKKYIDQDIIFTTYGICGKERGDDREKHVLHLIEWHRVILDESHYIKNGSCGAARSINTLRAKNKWCLTGTPFGRQIYDIHNQLQFVGLKSEHLSKLDLKTVSKRKVFEGSRSDFGKSICRPLMAIMQSLVMRHKKSQKFNNEAIVEMPEKEEDVITIEFTAKQRVYYNKLYSTAKERYDYYKALNNIGRGSISILASLHPARQACSGYVYSKDNIEQELSNAQARTFHIRTMVQSNANLNLSRTELYEMAEDEAFNDRDGECPICYECPFDEPLQTPCRHIFCGECIRAILNDKQLCPMCRKPVYPNQLKKPKEEKKEEADENHNNNTNDNSNNNNKDDNKESDKKETEDLDDSGDQIRFDSKLKVLIKELKKIKRERPEEKSLIFTSFSKSLNWMCSELKKNGFEYRTLTGSMSMNKRKKQLNEFSDNPNVKVFVLSVRSGAVGITLTAANHVFMLEPPFNAALHRQAINRVYRLGQKKKVFIHTLIMKDSIEERIWKVNKDKQNSGSSNAANANSNNKDLAGNICADKSAKLEQHEISKLFEGDA